MTGFTLIREKTASKALMKRCVKIGSPYLVPLSNLKYGVALPPLITYDSGFFIKICMHFRNRCQIHFFNKHIKKE